MIRKHRHIGSRVPLIFLLILFGAACSRGGPTSPAMPPPSPGNSDRTYSRTNAGATRAPAHRRQLAGKSEGRDRRGRTRADAGENLRTLSHRSYPVRSYRSDRQAHPRGARLYGRYGGDNEFVLSLANSRSPRLLHPGRGLPTCRPLQKRPLADQTRMPHRFLHRI